MSEHILQNLYNNNMEFNYGIFLLKPFPLNKSIVIALILKYLAELIILTEEQYCFGNLKFLV